MTETNPVDPALADELEAAYTAAASLVPELAADALQRAERVVLRAGQNPTRVQRAARPAGCRTYVRTAYGALACCHIQRGELAHAETALTIIGHPQVESSIHLLFLLDVRAQLRLAQLRPDAALQDALDAGRRLQE